LFSAPQRKLPLAVHRHGTSVASVTSNCCWSNECHTQQSKTAVSLYGRSSVSNTHADSNIALNTVTSVGITQQSNIPHGIVTNKWYRLAVQQQRLRESLRSTHAC
jgi:hypothetical protein